jgi:hypothetical protein
VKRTAAKNIAIVIIWGIFAANIDCISASNVVVGYIIFLLYKGTEEGLLYPPSY